MIKTIGLSHLSDNEIWTLILIAVVLSIAVGWISDLIMQRQGFGIFGNTAICLLGIWVGLAIYNNYYGRMTSPDMTAVSAFAIGSVIAHLVLLTVLKRVLRL